MGRFRGGESLFKFENMWLEVEGFRDLIKRWWEEVRVEGYSSFVGAKKLKVIKAEIRNGIERSLGISRFGSTISWILLTNLT